MEYQFEKGGKKLVAVDAGWKDNGCAVFDVEDANGSFVGSVMVHPLESIENAVADWLKAS